MFTWGAPPSSSSRKRASRTQLVWGACLVVFVVAFAAMPWVCAVRGSSSTSPSPALPVASTAPMAEPPPGEHACPWVFTALPPGESAECWCSRVQPSGSVWGSGPYSRDSALCLAAIHAGLVTAPGSRVRFRATPGLDRYPASTANGVATNAWGSFHGSYVVEPGSPGPAPVFEDAPITVTMTGDDGVTRTFSNPDDIAALARNEVTETTPATAPCPGHLPVPSSAAPTLTRCMCATPIESAPVWGDRRYSIDSGVCAAALHAEAIPATGGAVALWTLPGCGRYVGARRAGVTSRAGEATDASFTFDVGVESAGLSGAPPCP